MMGRETEQNKEKQTQGNKQREKQRETSTAKEKTKGTCIESKKKNMMRRETEAPRGRHIACTLSRVVTLFSRLQSIF